MLFNFISFFFFQFADTIGNWGRQQINPIHDIFDTTKQNTSARSSWLLFRSPPQFVTCLASGGVTNIRGRQRRTGESRGVCFVGTNLNLYFDRRKDVTTKHCLKVTDSRKVLSTEQVIHFGAVRSCLSQPATRQQRPLIHFWKTETHRWKRKKHLLRTPIQIGAVTPRWRMRPYLLRAVTSQDKEAASHGDPSKALICPSRHLCPVSILVLVMTRPCSGTFGAVWVLIWIEGRHWTHKKWSWN